MTDQALLLMAHGSRDRAAREEYVRIGEALAARVPDETVVFSVLEFPNDTNLPSIQEGWRRCLDAGARRIVALPFFLFPAGHVREDLPEELAKARQTIGEAEVEFLPPLGPADELLDVLVDRADESLATVPGGPRAGAGAGMGTGADGMEAGASGAGDRPDGVGERPGGPDAMLLVGAGTSDPDANGDLCKAARLVWERIHVRYPLVEAAWVSLTEPSVPQAVERCAKLGARRIAVVPYFLNTGILLKRIDARLAECRERYPDVPMPLGAHLGLHPRLLDLLESRARAGLDRQCQREGLLAVCGRSSCASVAAGRARLLGETRPATR